MVPKLYYICVGFVLQLWRPCATKVQGFFDTNKFYVGFFRRNNIFIVNGHFTY